MTEIRRILCPVDFSDFSRLALEYAGAIARIYRATIHGLHVVPMSAAPSGLTDYPALAAMSPVLRDRLTHDIRVFLGSVAGEGDAWVREGDVVEEITKAARALPADLLVMGTHGRGGFQRWILGSVAEKMIRRAPCPVLTVCHAPGGRVTAGRFERILCAVDFSTASLRALDYAVSLARESDAHLIALHAVESLAEQEPRSQAHFTVPEYRHHLQHDAKEKLRTLILEDARSACRIEEVVVAGRAHRAILHAAAERGAGLVVMGAHGPEPMDLLAFGSTSHHVVRGATCPVLTIRADDKRS